MKFLFCLRCGAMKWHLALPAIIRSWVCVNCKRIHHEPVR